MSYPVQEVPIRDPEIQSFVWLSFFNDLRTRLLKTTTDKQATSVPTTGTYNKLDLVINSSPSELGAPGSKYVIYGWYCIAGGSPGTWVEMRFLTGA